MGTLDMGRLPDDAESYAHQRLMLGLHFGRNAPANKMTPAPRRHIQRAPASI